ncbi:MAG: lipid II:glycine glycyltransferase FemX [Candidatus Hodarchaeota archaeon]
MISREIKYPENHISIFQTYYWAEFKIKTSSWRWLPHDKFIVLENTDFNQIYVGSITKYQLRSSILMIEELTEFLNRHLNRIDCAFIDFQIPKTDPFATELHYKMISLGYQSSEIEWQPRIRCLVDLTVDEQKIKDNCYNKTMSDIRRAERRGVKIIESWDVDQFYSLYLLTAKKHEFAIIKDFQYFKALCGMFQEYKIGKLLFASVENYPMMLSAIVAFVDGVAYWLFTGSMSEYNFFSASSYLQYHIIKKAKSMNMKLYDMFGIKLPIKEHGPSNFKIKFGGKIIPLMDTYVLNNKAKK